MSLSQPRQIFGIQNVSPYSRTDGTFYGILKVLASSTLAFSGSLVEVFGGASKFSWAVEDSTIKAEMTLKPKEYPDFLFSLFFGKAPTATGTDATGTLDTLTNVKGTSCKQASTGIASVQIKSSTGAADLKFGKYVVVVASATTVHVYASSDIDFGAKTNVLTYQSDLLKVTASPLTVTTGAVATDIPNTGVQLVGGSGTIGMTTGDTAVFNVRPPSSKGMSVVIGAAANVYPEFGAILMAQRRSTAELCEVDVYRTKAIGFPIGFDEFKWAEADIKCHVLYDSTLDAVCKISHLSES